MDARIIKTIIHAIHVPLKDKKVITRDMIFKEEKVNYKVGPSATTFYFALAKVNDLGKALKLNQAITMSVSRAMNLDHGKTLKVRITAQGGYLAVGVARLDRWLPSWADIQDKIDQNLFIGFNDFNAPVYLDLFSESSPGLFAVGSSGSGKTNLIRLLINQLREKEIEYYLIDLKGGRDWRYDLAHFAKDYAFEEEKAEEITNRLFKIMQARNKTNATYEPLVFVFDEVTEASEELQYTLGRMAKLCRSANIRLIFGAQRVGEDLNNEIKGNLKRRIVGWVSGADAFNATGVSQSGAQFLEMKGDMLVCHPHGTTRIQVPRANEKDLGFDLHDVEKPKPVKAVTKSPVKIMKSERSDLLTCLPIEKKRVFYNWFDRMVKAFNQVQFEKDAKVFDRKILFFSASTALETGKPPTIKSIEKKLKELEIGVTNRDHKRLIRYFGGLVVGDSKSLERYERLLAVGAA